jgi:DNA gyrase subunit A
MELQRPNLNQVDEPVRAYIEALEAEIARLQRKAPRSRATEADEELEPEAISEPSEPPTTLNIITATLSGYAKRTSRHLYTRQRRGGMGVFDLDVPGEEPPAIVAIADESDHLLVITNLARAFRMQVSAIPLGEVRDRGLNITERFNLGEGETLAAFLPDKAQGYVALVSKRGYVRMLRHHVFGEYMKPGTALYDPKAFGPLASACRTPGDGDLFIATRQGKAIRFSEKLVPPAGGLGIRLSADDEAIAITPVYSDSGVFLIGSDGKGTIRQMEGFSANKSPGAGGKIAFNTDHLVGASVVDVDDDIFVISRLSKIIRFPASQVPPKEGVVQGVICMSLRADETTAMAVSKPQYAF